MIEQILALVPSPLRDYVIGVAASWTAALFKGAKKNPKVPKPRTRARKALKNVYSNAFLAITAKLANEKGPEYLERIQGPFYAFLNDPPVSDLFFDLVLTDSHEVPDDLRISFSSKVLPDDSVQPPSDDPMDVFSSALGTALREELQNPDSPLHQWATHWRLEHLITLVGTDRDHRTPPPSRSHQLEGDLGDFTGRDDETTRLLEALGEGGGRAAISAIEGMGGIGKTALAVHVGHRLLEKYPDAQVQVNLQGFLKDKEPLEPAEAMARIIRAFHPEARLPDEETELAALYRSTLAGKRALILLDNAADAAQVKPLLADPPCAFIVTSRNVISLPSVRTIDLSALPEDKARELLRKILKERPVTDDKLHRIAELCGRLPLALRTAGTFLDIHRDWPLEEYLEALGQERARLEKLKVPDHELDVEAALGLSARQLVLNNPGLAAKWQLLTVFPATFERLAIAAVWEVPQDETLENLSDLFARSMLLYDEKARRYRLHDLMRPVASNVFEYAKEKAPDQGVQQSRLAEAEARHAQHYCTVLADADKLYLEGHKAVMRGLAVADLEWDNILAGHGWAVAHAQDNDNAADLCNRYPDAGVYVLALRLHPRQHIVWREAALQAARRLNLRQAEGVHLGNLGSAYLHLGDARRAIEYYEQALVIAHKIGDRRGVAADLNNLGNAYAHLGDPRRAIAYYDQDLEIAREMGDRRGEGDALNNLGLAYADSGETRRAIQHYEQALVIHREIGDRRGEGQDLGNVGIAYAHLGDPRHAFEYYQQQLTITREIDDQSGKAQALGNLGIAYRELGDARRAIEHYEQALVIGRQIGDRRGEGNALWNMSLAFDDLGDRDQAIANAEAALAIREQIEDPRADMVRQQLHAWRKG